MRKAPNRQIIVPHIQSDGTSPHKAFTVRFAISTVQFWSSPPLTVRLVALFKPLTRPREIRIITKNNKQSMGLYMISWNSILALVRENVCKKRLHFITIQKRWCPQKSLWLPYTLSGDVKSKIISSSRVNGYPLRLLLSSPWRHFRLWVFLHLSPANIVSSRCHVYHVAVHY